MQANRNIDTSYVNTNPSFKLCNIWDREFSKQIRKLGKDNGIFINIRKELKTNLGGVADTLEALIDLAKRYGNGFHHSNTEILHSIDNRISESKLYRDKKELIRRGILHIKAGVKNRTTYYLRAQWFQTFISDIFSKLGILQRQNDGSHIISNDRVLEMLPSHNNHCLKTLNEYDNLQKGSRVEPSKPTKPKSNNPVRPIGTSLAKEIASFTGEQQELFNKLHSYGIVVPLIVMFIRKLNLNQIYEKIEEAKKRNILPSKIGSYIRASLQNIENDACSRLTNADTSGKVINITREDTDMGRPTTPIPSAYQTLRTLSEHDDNFRQSKKASSVEAFKAAQKLFKQLNLPKNKDR